MRLPRRFVQLPLAFDFRAMAAEVAALEDRVWEPHPQGHPGNDALPLVAVGGDPKDNGVGGEMRPTPVLEELPAIRDALAALDTPVGRTRLMRIQGNGEATPHIDTNLYWLDRLRIHIPLVTTPGVRFVCGGESVHMAAGECWVFDTWTGHNVLNPDEGFRIHLVVDTVGSTSLWRMLGTLLDETVPPAPRAQETPEAPEPLEIDLRRSGRIRFERYNLPEVASPGELEGLCARLQADLGSVDANKTEELQLFGEAMRSFLVAWRAEWAVCGPDAPGRYGDMVERAMTELRNRQLGLRCSNGSDATEMAWQMVFRHARREGTRVDEPDTAGPRSTRRRNSRPMVIVSPPRAGSTLLFETLARSPDVFTIGRESHVVIESIPGLHPSDHDYDSNRLTEADATPGVAARLDESFARASFDRDGNQPAPGRHDIRLLEKTPKNALRIPFLDAIYPDAVFIYLYRDPREELSSMLDAWRSGHFVTYPNLPGWSGDPWSLLLTPGWRDLVGSPLAEVVAHQWATTTSVLLDDLEALEPSRWCVAGYQGMIEDPLSEVQRICRFVGIGWDDPLDAPLPLSRHTLSPPNPHKWKRNAAGLEPVLPIVEEVAARARSVFGETVSRMESADAPRGVASSSPVSGGETSAAGQPLPSGPPEVKEPAGAGIDGHDAPGAVAAQAPSFDSVHTSSLPELLRQSGSTLLVSTYKSGHLILVRAEPDGLNTHFCSFLRPMGIALDGLRRLAIGTGDDVRYLHNQPDLTTKLEPAGRHDAVFHMRQTITTGDISVHEMAFDLDGELWVVNTRFSSLCTLAEDVSFVPRWRPKWVSGLSPDDRCHLNGLAMLGGRPEYVTALAMSDEAGGWRDLKGTGGVIVHVPTGEVVAHGLSMPHSPRVHGGRLWVLQSGRGELATVDPETGRTETVAVLPGFTRGLAFIGRYALVGLSKVRETVFDGLPITEREDPRACGVWAIDTTTGAVAGFIEFNGSVEEIFDVQVLEGSGWPTVLEGRTKETKMAFVLPDEALAEVVGPPAGNH